MKQFKLLLILSALTLCANVNAYKKTSVDINVNGQSRNMVVFTPNALSEGLPLMLVTHGMNQDPEYQYGADKMYELIDTAKFVIAYLRGIDKSWDMNDGGKDKNFVLKAIDEMTSRYGIDTNRVYWSGFSMGSMFMYAVMGSMTDKIAAFAPCSGMMGDPSGSIKKKINLIHCHAYGDDVVVYNQFNIRNNVTKIANNLKYTHYTKRANYKTKNGTSWFSGDREMWTNDEGNEIVLYSFNVDFHNPMGENSYEIWNFCKRFSLDPNIPKVSIVSPNTDDKYTRVDTINVEIEASDPDGYVASIALMIDGAKKCTETFTDASSDGKYALNYVWIRPSQGNHTLKVVATDNDGKTRDVSRTVTIADADPLTIVSSDPENNSFDLPLDFRTFNFTFSYPIDCSKVKASMSLGGKNRYFDVVQTGFCKEVTFVLPDTIELETGKRSLRLTGLNDNRGVTLTTQTYRFTFGYADVNDKDAPSDVRKIKKAFYDAYSTASAIYDSTAAERYQSAEYLREPIKELIDLYADFASTSPSRWNEATDTLASIIIPLQTRKENLDLYYDTYEYALSLINQYANDSTVNSNSRYTRLQNAVNSTMYKLKPANLIKDDKLITAASGLQRYIDQLLSLVTSIGNVTVESQSNLQEYDILGRPVKDNYKGIVIINGKKVVKVH